MAGGEFCGNAAMCAAVHYLQHVHPELEEGKVNVYFPGISDIVDPVVVEVSQQTDETWEGCVSMPLPLSINFERLSFGAKVPVVRFPGIVHVLMDYDSLKIDKNMSIGYFKDMAVDLGKKYKSSLGLIFYKLEDLLVQPLVYVPAVDSAILESSCASGVAAIGAFQAERLQQPVDYTFYFQNTAPLTVHAVHDVELQLTGKLEVKKTSVPIPFLL
jgi:diaminopimelate epimerase